MNTVQRIAKNTGVLFISNIVSKVFSFFYVMYTARYLGAEGFGILSFALAFTGIFGVFTDLGLNPLTVREVARDKSLAGKYLNNITVMKLILVIITFALIALVINILGYPLQTIKVVYLIALSIIFSAFTRIFYSIFQAFEKMEYQSLGQVLKSILIFSGVMLAIKYNFTIIDFASIYLIASIVVLGYSLIILRGKFSNPVFASKNKIVEIDWSFWKPTIKEALPFGLTGIFVTIYYWTDSVMLSLMQGNEVVGWYNAAYRLILILLFIPSIINVSIFPIMSRFYVSSEDLLRFTYKKFFKYMAIIGIPLGVGVTLLANKIILLIFGAEYINSIIALQILVWSSVFIFLSSAFARLLESSNRQLTITKITAINALANVILNLILIPKFSYIGASIATVITEFSALMFSIIVCSKIGYGLSKKDLLGLSKVFIASLLMGIFIIYLKDLNLLFLVLLPSTFYFFILYLFKEFEEEDIKMFRIIINGSSKGK